MFSAFAIASRTSLVLILFSACGRSSSIILSAVMPVNCMYWSRVSPCCCILWANSSSICLACVSTIASGRSILADSMIASTAASSCALLPSFTFCSLILALISVFNSSRVSNSETSAANSSSISGSSFALISWTVHLNTASFPLRSSAW